jgi:uncharacterized protein
MDKRTREILADWIFSFANEKDPVKLVFGGGETLLKFREFFDFVRMLYNQAQKHGIKLSIDAGTNGVLVDESILPECARLNINLDFSIDGDAHCHDRFRKDKNGRPTHHVALKNWRAYKDLTRGSGTASSIQSVFTGHCRLGEILGFWESQGERLVNVNVQQPSRFTGDGDDDAWEARRRAYLRDFKEIAEGLASTLTIPGFLSDFSGPHPLYKLWSDIFMDRSPSTCGAGVDTLGVTAAGDFYPCETFAGDRSWNLGNVFDGPDEEKINLFQASRQKALQACGQCESGKLCPGACFKAGDDGEIMVNSKGGCGFMKDIIAIARDSYALMKEKF